MLNFTSVSVFKQFKHGEKDMVRGTHGGEKRNTEGKNLLERLSCRHEDNIKMDLKKIGWECVDYINLIQGTGQSWGAMNKVLDLQAQ